MQQSVNWDGLSQSSRLALRWAAALAICRRPPDSSTSQSPLDAFDLLIGILLSHPERSEAQTLLKHFGLTVGQLLPDDYQRPDNGTLMRAARAIPDDAVPPMSDEVASIVQRAEDLHSRSSDSSVVELRFLFGAMLQDTNPVNEAIHERIEPLGTCITDVAATTEDYLVRSGKDGDYASFLADKHPVETEPIELPRYQPDHGGETDLSNDLVGIRADVDAFAYLLSSRDLKPPLAIGLFGDWGSGKSFFMEAVEKRVANLTEIALSQNLPQKEVPIWKRVVQIRFNAWHYMEGELWASLVEHIFSRLKVGTEDPESTRVEARRRYWVEKITDKRKELEQINADLETKSEKREELVKTVHDLERQRDAELRKQEDLKSRKIADQVLSKSLAQTWQKLLPLLDTTAVTTLGEAVESVKEAKRELQQTASLARPFVEDRATTILSVAALVILPFLVWLVQAADLSQIQTVLATLAAVGAPVGTVAAKATAWLRDRRKVLEEAEAKLTEEIRSVETTWNQQIDAVRSQVADLDRQLSTNRIEETRLTAELQDLEKKRDSVTSVSLTNEFVAKRTGSQDYRRLLGLPALIQKDFKTLSEMVAEQNRDILDKHPEYEDQPQVINRIILYIDDLDRCPDKYVIKVLQAVHLLLAFDLFVVIVAVDARWLNHALVDKYPALARASSGENQPSSDDYLEKIFQIPFWIEPLAEPARTGMVSGLLRTQISGGADRNGGNGEGTPLQVGQDEGRILDAINDRAGPLRLQAADLSVSNEELTFLNSLSALLGDTPRAVKRFVNLYQLLRIIHRPAPASMHLSPSDHEILAFILAVGDGLPGLASTLLLALSDEGNSNDLGSVLKNVAQEAIDEELRLVKSWVESRPDWTVLAASRMTPLAALAKRFLFRVGSENRTRPADAQ